MSNAPRRSGSGRERGRYAEGFQFGALGFDAGVEFGFVGGPVEPLAEKEVLVGDFHFLNHILRAGHLAGVGGEKRGEITESPLRAHSGRVPVVDTARLADVGVFCGGDGHAVGEVTTSWSAALW